MKKIILRGLALFMLFFSGYGYADDKDIKKSLGQLMPDSKIDVIRPAGIKNLYEVVSGANIFYVSEDGRYLLQGQLYDALSKTNVTEKKLSAVRIAALDKIGEKNMIIFKPDENKHFVSVFTDIDCGYCRKLHSEIDKYLAEGITVRYLFFPRAGKGSDSYRKAISVWCASDKQKALTAAKKGDSVDSKTCENPVDEHMALGKSFGMTGTPMIVTEKGNILSGYVPAAELAKILDKE